MTTDDSPDLASAAKSAADFLDSYTDESELARRSPLLVEIMRAHAAEVRSALAAHDQQGDPDDEPEQVQLAMVPLPGNGRYSVTVEHQADRCEDHYQTQEWEVWAKDGNVRVEPMTYPEPGVSDTKSGELDRMEMERDDARGALGDAIDAIEDGMDAHAKGLIAKDLDTWHAICDGTSGGLRRRLDELRSAARDLLDARSAKLDAVGRALPSAFYDDAAKREREAERAVRALVAPSVPETEETKQ